MNDTLLDALVATERYRGCSRRELAAIARTCTPIAVPAGRVIVREQRPGRDFGIVVHGCARVSVDGAEVAVLQEGDHFGGDALLGAAPGTARITALTPMTIAVAGPREFDRLLAQCPTLARAVRGEGAPDGVAASARASVVFA